MSGSLNKTVSETQEKGCDKKRCFKRDYTNPNLRKKFCYSERAQSCLYNRKDCELGMFYTPDGGQHYFS
ncbi:MAG: hypothetical protein ABH811_00735 [archaeon]